MARLKTPGWAAAIVIAATLALAVQPAVAATPMCAAPFQGTAARTADPANPLGLAAPTANPIAGARLFIPGPGHGQAAGAIATLLRENGVSSKRVADYGNESWAAFVAELNSPPLAARIAARPTLARQIALLSKIASEPETARFSAYSGGGGPGAMYAQAQKFLCRIAPATPVSETQPAPPALAGPEPAIPLISTYLLKHGGASCSKLTMDAADVARFKRRVRELASGLYGWSAIVLVEIDALMTAPCLSHSAFVQRLELLKWMVATIHAKDPHVVLYLEAAAADASCPAFAAAGLNYIDGRSTHLPHACPHGVRAIGAATTPLPVRGFYVNDTHFDWTAREMKYGLQVARLTGLHFIVATQDNGRGPLAQKHKVANGNTVLCNPRNAGLGPRPTTNTGFAGIGVDAFEWSGVPGLSGGSGPGCNGAKAPPGIFDLGFALQLAANANEQLGPGYPSRPY